MIWFVDDDPDNRTQYVEFFDDFDVRCYESCFEAARAVGSPKLVVIDLSACGSFDHMHSLYSPICGLIERHPHATYVIRSAMPKSYADDVVNDVLGIMEEATVRSMSFDSDSALRALMVQTTKE